MSGLGRHRARRGVSSKVHMDNSHLAMLAVSDTGFVFDPRTGHSYTVNSTGLALLRSLKEGTTPAQFEEDLRASFECPASIATDIGAFMNTLDNYELFESDPKGSHSP